MTTHTEIFENHTLEIDSDGGLSINGKEIHYEHDPVTNTWSASYLPYTQYSSLLALAQAIVRDTVEFIDTQE